MLGVAGSAACQRELSFLDDAISEITLMYAHIHLPCNYTVVMCLTLLLNSEQQHVQV